MATKSFSAKTGRHRFEVTPVLTLNISHSLLKILEWAGPHKFVPHCRLFKLLHSSVSSSLGLQHAASGKHTAGRGGASLWGRR